MVRPTIATFDTISVISIKFCNYANPALNFIKLPSDMVRLLIHYIEVTLMAVQQGRAVYASNNAPQTIHLSRTSKWNK